MDKWKSVLTIFGPCQRFSGVTHRTGDRRDHQYLAGIVIM